jgi:hypothetical protein
MEGTIFILKFEHCSKHCCDAEYRVCVAGSIENATKVAKEYRDKYLKDWSYSIITPNWALDNSAFVCFIYDN